MINYFEMWHIVLGAVVVGSLAYLAGVASTRVTVKINAEEVNEPFTTSEVVTMRNVTQADYKCDSTHKPPEKTKMDIVRSISDYRRSRKPFGQWISNQSKSGDPVHLEPERYRIIHTTSNAPDELGAKEFEPNTDQPVDSPY